MLNYNITIDTLNEELKIAIEANDIELANAIKIVIDYLKDINA